MAALGYFKTVTLLFSVFLIFCVSVTLGFSSNAWPKLRNHVQIYSFEVVNEFYHDPLAYTQGLVYAENDILFESTGLYGRSSLRQVALETGKVEVFHQLDDSYFGEGLTLIDETLYQLTYLTQTGFKYSRYNFNKSEEFTHHMTDGWGLATDGKVLFGSDGTSTLYKIDPRTMKNIEKHVVKYNGKEVPYLNELEFVDGEVWANVFRTDCIARISPTDGRVIGWILLPELREELIAEGYLDIDVLNGIAWDSEKDRIFVTGKLWPKLFEIRVFPSKKHIKPRDVESMCVRSSIRSSFPLIRKILASSKM